MTDWRPTATLSALQKRSQLLAAIRDYFSGNAQEVDLPCLGTTGVTDLHIDNIQVSVNNHPAFLQSSPEYFIKRLLAAGSDDLYYLGKAYRDNEAGRRHNPEFTLLEWYRLGWDEQQLMEEVANLLTLLAKPARLPITHLHYGDIFENVTGINPHQNELSDLQALASKISGNDFSNEPRTTCLDLIFSLQVEPQLPEGLSFIDHYPTCQSALAKLGRDERGNAIALRFEAFLDGIELANGYCELTDPVELRSRFNADIALRKTANKKPAAIDENFMAAMERGLPDCAGVALGVDRLLMYLLDTDNIQDVLAFSFKNSETY